MEGRIGLRRTVETCAWVGFLFLPIASSSPAGAQCAPGWKTFPMYSANNRVRTLISFDQGSGIPVLYAGGEFTTIGFSDVYGIARLDPASPPALSTLDYANTFALASFDADGAGPEPPSLYLGGQYGEFTLGVEALNRWDGNSIVPIPGLARPGGASVYAMVVFDDDGNGPHLPALYVAGSFLTADSQPANNIARWDGSSWSVLGTGTDGWIDSLAVFDDDGDGPHPPALYAGGNFTTAGGVSASGIAKWDGSSWSALSSGVNGFVNAMASYDDDGPGPDPAALYVGGTFTTAGGASCNRIARWDGSSWSPLGTGTDNEVIAMTVHDDDGAGPHAPALYVGGLFTTAGGVSASAVARWDGTAWSALAQGILGPVYALTSHDPDGAGPEPPKLIVGGGTFASAGQVEAHNLAQWDGVSWSAIGTGIQGTWPQGVSAMTIFDEDGPGPEPPVFFMGGAFTSVGNIPARNIARWDGLHWSDVAGGRGTPVSSFCIFDDDGPGPHPPALYSGGRMDGHDFGIARWDGSTWSPLGTGLGFGVVYAMAVFDDDGDGPLPPALYVGGSFNRTVSGIGVNGIARWDGTEWSAVGGGMSAGSAVRALVVFDPDGPGPAPAALYAGGDFTSAGGNPATSHIAKWDGSSWSGVGGGIVGGTVASFAIYDDDGPGPNPRSLFVGGGFSSAGGVTVSDVARWDGTTWSAVGDGVWFNGVSALTVFDEDGTGPGSPVLIAGGQFDRSGSLPLSNIARWDGHAWSSVGSGTGVYVGALASFDDDGAGPLSSTLWVGGGFTMAGGLPSTFLAQWTGCGSSVSTFCFGDGSTRECPCGNDGAPGHGCENSGGTSGAILGASGNAALSYDTFVLASSDELPNTLTVFLQGNASIAPALFGDGLRCVGGSLKRLYKVHASGGVATAPASSDPPVSVRSAQKGDAFSAGAERYYQAYYRDSSATFCPSPTGSTFNASSGIAVVWSP